MSIRCLALRAVALSLVRPMRSAAQAEMSQCRGSGNERTYPCRTTGNVIRSERDHARYERLTICAKQRVNRDHVRNDRRYQQDDRATEIRRDRESPELLFDRCEQCRGEGNSI